MGWDALSIREAQRTENQAPGAAATTTLPGKPHPSVPREFSGPAEEPWNEKHLGAPEPGPQHLS